MGSETIEPMAVKIGVKVEFSTPSMYGAEVSAEEEGWSPLHDKSFK